MTTATSRASRGRSRPARRSASCCPPGTSSTAPATRPTRRRATATAPPRPPPARCAPRCRRSTATRSRRRRRSPSACTGTIAPASPLPAAKYPVALDGADEGRAQRGGCRHRRLRARAAGRRVDGARAGDRQLQGGRACGSRPPRSPSAACRRTRRRARSRATRSRARRARRSRSPAASQNLVQGNRMTGNGRPAIDLGADGRTPNDAKDADGGANGRHNFPIGVLAERDPVTKALMVSGVDAAAVDAGDAIDIYAQSAASGRARRRADGLRRLDRGQLHGRLGARRPRLACPPATRSSARRSRRGQDGTSELSPICTDPDGDGNPTPTATACATTGSCTASTPTTTGPST